MKSKNNVICVLYKGELVECTKSKMDDKYKIMRLISTNPASYTKSYFMPGTIMDSKDIKKI